MGDPSSWRIDDIEREAKRAVSRLHEIDTLNSAVTRLERQVHELLNVLRDAHNEINDMREQLGRHETTLECQATEIGILRKVEE